MSAHDNDMMSMLVSLANDARTMVERGDAIHQAKDMVSKRIGHEDVVIISALELSDIKFVAKDDGAPSVGDVNSHNDKWVGADGSDLGTISGEGWKIASLDNDVISYYRETAETPFGRIETAGIWNSSSIWRQSWQSLFAVGVNGMVTGKLGVRQIYQEIPRQRYKSFLLLIPMEAVGESLRRRIKHGFSAPKD